jgi:hypothetical protein
VVTGQNVALNWTGDTTADDVILTYDFNTLTYEYSDSGHTIAVTPNASIVITNNNTSAVEIAPAMTFSVSQLNFTDGTNVTPVTGNTYNLESPNFGAPIDMIGPGATGTVADNVVLGSNASGLGSGFPTVTISSYTGSSAAGLTVDDLGGSTAQTYTMTASTVSTGAGIVANYTGSNLSALILTTTSVGDSTVDVNSQPIATPAPLILIDASGTGNSVNLGDPANPASGLHNIFLLGTAALTVDDSGDASGKFVGISSNLVEFDVTELCDYSGATLSSLIVNSSTAGGNTIQVGGTPVGAATTINSGGGPGNTVGLGTPGSPAFGLGSITLLGTSALTVDDTTDASGKTIDISSSQVDFDPTPAFVYSGATITSLSVKARTNGGNTIDVASTPAGASTTINSGTSGTNSVNLGNLLDPASELGSITLLGKMGLTVNEFQILSLQQIDITSSQLDFDATPAFNYSGATVSTLSLNAVNALFAFIVDVNGTPAGASTTIDTANLLTNIVDLGSPSHPASTLGNVTLLGNSHLTIDDSGDATGRTYVISGASATIGAAPTFTYSGASLDSLTFLGGVGSAVQGNTVQIDGTPNGTSGSPITTTYDASASTNAGDGVEINATSQFGPLVVDFQGGSAGFAYLGFASELLSPIVGAVSIENTTNQFVTFDDTEDPNSATGTLIESGGLSQFTGPNPGTVTFDPTSTSGFNYFSGGGTAELIVDFSGGNPLPTGHSVEGQYFGKSGGSSTLVLQGELPGPTPFSTENYAPMDGSPGSGTIVLSTNSATTTFDFFRLSPINDTTPATNYTFTAPASASVVDLTNGPTIGGVVTDTISSGDNPPAFELVNFGNKTNVTIDVTAMTNPTVDNTITVPATGLQSLQVVTNGSGQTITITNTPAGMTTTFDLEGSGNTLNVLATTGPLVITATSTGPNTVNLGTNDGLSTINGAVTVNGNPGTDGAITLNLDDSANPNSESPIVEFDSTNSLGEIVGLAPATIEYQVSTIGLLGIDTGSGPANVLTVDFASGNPIPGNSGGLSYDGGSAASSTLDLENGSFPNETYAPFGPGAGTVTFFDQASIAYTITFSDLRPINDTVAVTNFTFIAPAPFDPATAQGYEVDLLNGPVVLGFQTATISSPATPPNFELVNYANKTNVTVQMTGISLPGNTVDAKFVYDNTTQATGQATLSALLGTGDDTVSVQGTPNGVASSINTGSGNDLVTVLGTGLATGVPLSSLFVDGGTGVNTLRVDAQGTTANLSTLGTVTFGGLGGPSFTYSDFSNIEVIETNHAPVIVASPSITTAKSVPIVNTVVGMFTDTDLIENATSYTAAINWGDGSAVTAGTIAAVPGVPGEFTISGSHTYTANGPFAIAVTVTDNGGLFPASTDSVPYQIQLNAVAPVTGAGSSVTITSGRIVGQGVNIFPIVNVAYTGTIATFQDLGGAEPVADYTVTINWGDGTSTPPNTPPNVVTFAGGTFTVTGTHTYTSVGSFTITTTVTNDLGGTAVLTGTATVSPLPPTPLVPGTSFPVKATAGTLLPSTALVTFSNGATPLAVGDYSAFLNWGDGSAIAPATISLTGTTFTVSGSHNFAQAGAYTITVQIDAPGQQIVMTTTATVSGLAVTPVSPLTATAGTTTGSVVIATVTAALAGSPTPDPTAYVASVNWGDGSTPVATPITLVAGVLDVTPAGHNYATPGTYTLVVTITDNQGFVVGTGSPTITVGGLTVSPFVGLNGVVGTPIAPITVASFTATPAPAGLGYTALVDWGDGSTPVVASITAAGGGLYNITTSGHAYSLAGTYSLVVTVTDGQGVVVGTANPGLTVSALTIVQSTETATAGTPTGAWLVAIVFATPNPSVLAYSATIDWGDGSTTAAGTIVTGDGGALNVTSGGHEYATPGTYTVGLTLTDAQGFVVGVSTATATVNSLTGTPTTPLVATAGTATGALTVASFTADPSPLISNYTAIVDWGDGSTPAVATLVPGVGGAFSVTTGGHNYAKPATYTLVVTVTDAQGAVVGTTSPTLIASPLSVAPILGLNALAGEPTGPLVVASFTASAGAPNPAASGYSALVDWGDSLTPTVATITLVTPTSWNIMTSGHTYVQGSTSAIPLLVTIRDGQGFVVGTATPSITVSTSISGRLSPQSDTGYSDSDGITNDITPTFVGNTTPGTEVAIFAAAVGSPTPGTQVATGEADSSGAWSATVVNTPLAGGTYVITAQAYNTFGQVLSSASLGTIVIDTVAPTITALSFNRFDATLTVTFQDNLSGMDLAALSSSSFYHMSARPLSKKVPVPRLMLPTSISLDAAGLLPTDPITATVVFNKGRALRGGNYRVIINSGPGDFGMQDIAGNPLDGNFYGVFPSGDGLPGGDFVATIATFHHLVLPAVPIKDGYVAPSLSPTGTVLTAVPAVRRAAAVPAVHIAAASARITRLHHDVAIEALSHTHFRGLTRRR